jgi:hypothetical protein
MPEIYVSPGTDIAVQIARERENPPPAPPKAPRPGRASIVRPTSPLALPESLLREQEPEQEPESKSKSLKSTSPKSSKSKSKSPPRGRSSGAVRVQRPRAHNVPGPSSHPPRSSPRPHRRSSGSWEGAKRSYDDQKNDSKGEGL